MRDVVVGWLGVAVFVVAVLAAIGADIVRQREVTADEAAERRQPGGRLFWLTVPALVLAVVAAAFTVIRLTTLA